MKKVVFWQKNNSKGDQAANLPNKVPQSEAAETLNIGDRSLRYANQVIQSGTPELIKAVDDGKEQIAGLI